MKVWYVSYGSNMNQERFLSYINGTKSKYSTKTEQGTLDKTPPMNIELFKMKRDLTFKKYSSNWGGSVLFLKDSMNHSQYFVRYLISSEQFIDIVKQENGIDVFNEIPLSIKELKNKKNRTIFKDHWYGELIYLGDYDEIPMYSFTGNDEILCSKSHKTSTSYLRTIFNGLSSFDVSKEDIVSSFIHIDGVKEYYNKSELMSLFE